MKCKFCGHDMKLVETALDLRFHRVRRWDSVYYNCEHCGARGPEVKNMSLPEGLAGLRDVEEEKRLEYAKDICNRLTLGQIVEIPTPREDEQLKATIKVMNQNMSILKACSLPNAEKKVAEAKRDLLNAQAPENGRLHNYSRYALLADAYNEMAQAHKELFYKKHEYVKYKRQMREAQKRLQELKDEAAKKEDVQKPEAPEQANG